MTETMIQRVAKAIYEDREFANIAFGAMPEFDGLGDYDKTSLLEQAEAAIEAMREPTDMMVEAGAIGSGEDSEAVALGAWEAMIDEALK